MDDGIPTVGQRPDAASATRWVSQAVSPTVTGKRQDTATDTAAATTGTTTRAATGTCRGDVAAGPDGSGPVGSVAVAVRAPNVPVAPVRAVASRRGHPRPPCS